MNKTFAVVALAATSVSAEYLKTIIDVDGSDKSLYFKSQSFSSAYLDENGNRINIENNNSVFLKTSENSSMDFAFKPYIRGGAISYDVDLTSVDCGCVSGFYLVAVNDYGCGDQANVQNPMCPSIDVFQANPYGFNIAAHPCANGTCDARSQCEYNMKVDGVDKYGGDAYGPGGLLIDTDAKFNIKTEFISDRSYVELWGLRTRITQGDNEMVLEADCSGYLEALSNNIEGGMGLAFSSWDNRDYERADFECEGMCPEPAPTCNNAMNQISNIRVEQWGYNEDRPDPNPEPNPDPTPDPTPDPEPVPADFQPFIGDTDYWGADYEFYVKGLDGRRLSTSGREITMGDNNRAFVVDYPYDDRVYWSYWHNYLGGTVSFDVDVSDVECACAAGVFLVQLDDYDCSWDAFESDTTPQCSSMDLMEANIWGFAQASHPCEFGSCDVDSQSTAFAYWADYSFGPGQDYTINTYEKYNVEVKFWATDAEAQELVKIVTTLSQGDNSIELVQDNADYLAPLADKLYYSMAMGISSYALEQDNHVAGGCSNVCEAAGAYDSKISNLVYTMGDSIMSDEYVEGGPAPRLDLCGSGCTECRQYYWTSAPDQFDYQCVDDTVYKYGNQCGSNQDRSKCMTDADQLCHKSFPLGDEDKFQSADAACRTIPQANLEGDFMYANRECRKETAGLCAYGCEGTCHNSWKVEDPLKWKSATAMCRCMLP